MGLFNGVQIVLIGVILMLSALAWYALRRADAARAMQRLERKYDMGELAMEVDSLRRARVRDSVPLNRATAHDDMAAVA